jgi:hypothetical protein
MVSPSLEAMLLRFMLDAHFIGVRKATFSIFQNLFALQDDWCQKYRVLAKN